MPRSINLSVNPEKTDDLITQLNNTDGIISIEVYRGVSEKPKGDVIHLLVANKKSREIMKVLNDNTRENLNSFTLSRPVASFSRSSQSIINDDISETIWEEAELAIQETSQVTANFITLMIISGALAAIGLSSGALHIVIAAMLLIPGFEPIISASLGSVIKNRRLISLGIRSTFTGYGVFILSSSATFILLWIIGATNPVSFVQMPMVQYWASYNASSYIIPIIATIAGVIVILMDKEVLTAGVMIALTLVPGAAILGICLVGGQWEYALRGLGKWSLNAGIVFIIGYIVIKIKDALVHKRNSYY